MRSQAFHDTSFPFRRKTAPGFLAAVTWHDHYRSSSLDGQRETPCHRIEEVAAIAMERAVRPQICFWRTQAGAEVDLVIGDGRRLVPIEIKLGASVDHRGIAGLRQFMKDLDVRKGWVISTTSERRKIGRGIEIVPWLKVVRGE